MKVEVRKNNVDKAMRILKKKLTADGIFNELRAREPHTSRAEKMRHERAAAERRPKRNPKTRLEEPG